MIYLSNKGSRLTPPPGSRLNHAHSQSSNLVARWIFNNPDGVLVPELVYGPQALAAVTSSGLTQYNNGNGFGYGAYQNVNALLTVTDDSRITDISLAPYSFAILVSKFSSNATGFFDKSNGGGGTVGWQMYTEGSGDDAITFLKPNSLLKTTNTFNFNTNRTRVFHICVTGDGTSNANNCHIYIDGVEQGYSNNITAGAAGSDTGFNLKICNASQTSQCNISISDFAIYKTQLRPDQVAALAAAPYDNIYQPNFRTYFFVPASLTTTIAGVANNPLQF